MLSSRLPSSCGTPVQVPTRGAARPSPWCTRLQPRRGTAQRVAASAGEPGNPVVSALLNSLQPTITRLPPSLLLLVAQVSASTQTRLTATQLRLLSTAWQQHTTSPEQDIALLSHLAATVPQELSSSRRTEPHNSSQVPQWWQQNVYTRVGQAAQQLSSRDLIRFLEAALKLGGLQQQICNQVVQALSRAPGAGGLFGGLTASEAAHTLIVSAKLGASPPIPLLNALVSKVEADVQSLDPVLFLEALQAAASLSYDLELSQMISACNRAHPMLPSLPVNRLVACLAAASQCASQMPSIMLQLTTPTTTTSGASQDAATAVQALKQLVVRVCQLLTPTLPQLPPAQLATISQALQQCRYTDLAPSPRAGLQATGVQLGAGQGVHGDAMVNSFPVTILAPSIPANAAQQASFPSATTSLGEPTATATPTPAFAATGAASDSAQHSSTEPASSGAASHDSQAFLQQLHAAYMQQIGAFKDTDQLADVVRPLARLRALPPRDLTGALADKLVASNQAWSTSQGQQGTAAMSDHAVCMALFLFSMLGYRPGEHVLKAAQAQLSGTAMLGLSPGDLTSAIWAFACLSPEPTPVTVSPARAGAGPPQGGSSTEGAGSTGAQASSNSNSSSGSMPGRSRTLADIAAANTANAANRQAAGGDSAPGGRTAGARRGGVMSSGAAGQRTVPAPTWLAPALQALQVQLDAGRLAPYQIAFILGSLERTKTHLSQATIDLMLASFRAQLSAAGTGDVTLLLASVARLGHVTSYSWMEEVVESWMMPRLPSCSPKELSTLAWSLATLHHRPPMEFLTALVDAAEVRLSSFTPDNICTLVWSVAQLDADAPVTLFLDSMCAETQARLPSFNPRDLVALVAALARLRYQPPAEWLSDWLRAVDCHLRYIDSQGLSQMISALAVLDVKVTSSSWWGRLMHRIEKALPDMDAESLLAVAAGLSCMQFNPSTEWSQAFSRAVDRLCVTAAPTWGRPASESEPASSDVECLSATQHELMLGAQLKLGIVPTSCQMQHLEQQLSGLSVIRGLGAERLLRLVGGLAAVVSRWGTDAPVPRAAWLGGPFAEALRGALPDMSLVQQSQLARILGDLVAGVDARWQKIQSTSPGSRSSGTLDSAGGLGTGQPGQVDEFGAVQAQSVDEPGARVGGDAEPAPAALKNLLAYLKEFYLYGGKS